MLIKSQLNQIQSKSEQLSLTCLFVFVVGWVSALVCLFVLWAGLLCLFVCDVGWVSALVCLFVFWSGLIWTVIGSR